jgi:hypothetical protein
VIGMNNNLNITQLEKTMSSEQDILFQHYKELSIANAGLKNQYDILKLQYEELQNKVSNIKTPSVSMLNKEEISKLKRCFDQYCENLDYEAICQSLIVYPFIFNRGDLNSGLRSVLYSGKSNRSINIIEKLIEHGASENKDMNNLLYEDSLIWCAIEHNHSYSVKLLIKHNKYSEDFYMQMFAFALRKQLPEILDILESHVRLTSDCELQVIMLKNAVMDGRDISVDWLLVKGLKYTVNDIKLCLSDKFSQECGFVDIKENPKYKKIENTLQKVLENMEKK